MLKNDFVDTCKKYLKTLKINLSFDEIKNLSKWSFTRLMKKMTTECAFKYLLEEKNKQKKICNIKYDKLQIQDYLLSENENTKMAKLIFKARSRTLDIKCFKTWKYNDLTCTGCNVNEETEIEILKCEGFGVEKEEMKYEL